MRKCEYQGKQFCFYVVDGIWIDHECLSLSRLEDYDVDEEDEEALIEQRRLQRLAIMQVRILLIPAVDYTLF